MADQEQRQGQDPSRVLSQVQGEGAGGFVPGSAPDSPPGDRPAGPDRTPGAPTDDGARSDGHGGNPDSPFRPGEGGEGEVESWHQGQSPRT